MRALRNNCHSSKFAHYLKEHMHSFGSIQNIVQIIYYQKKGPHLQTTEGFYILREGANDNQLNDKESFPIKFLTHLKYWKTSTHSTPSSPYHTFHRPTTLLFNQQSSNIHTVQYEGGLKSSF